MGKYRIRRDRLMCGCVQVPNKALMGSKVVGWMMYGKGSESLVVQRDCSKISEPLHLNCVLIYSH